MEENLEEPSQCSGSGTCAACRKRAEYEEAAFAFLLALIPTISLTLFGNMGLL